MGMSKKQLMEAVSALSANELAALLSSALSVASTPAGNKPKRHRQAAVARSTVSAPKAPVKSPKPNRTPTVHANAQAIMDEREQQLEAVLPGILTVADVYHLGKNVLEGKPGQTEFTKDPAYMANVPWTWIDLPNGKNFTINGLEPDEVREALKDLGYGFSHASQKWCTSSRGFKPCRTPGRQARGVGKAYQDV